MKKLFWFLLFFISTCAQAACNSDMSESHVQNCENHTGDVESHEAVCCTIPIPLADYRFDACSWDGSDGEVIDQTGNYNATVKNGTTLTDAKLNHGGSFDGTDDYIELPTIDAAFSDGITISAWVDFGGVNDYERVVELSSGRCDGDWCADNYISLWRDGDSDTLRFQIRQGTDNGGNEGVTLQSGLHHYVATYNHSNGEAKIYIDGSVEGSWTYDTEKFNPNAVLDHNYIGKTVWDEEDGDPDTDYPFGGIIDEVKLYNGALTESQVQDIYNNESAHKNYDGSHRMAIDCTTPVLLAEYRFDECKYTGATGEVVDSAGGDNSGTITGDVNISKDEKKIGHSLYLNGGAVDIDNLAVTTEPYRKHTVMFWMYWDGTKTIMPFGWRTYDLLFLGSHFGFNAGGGLIYGIDQNSLKNGWHHLAAVFTNGDVESNRLYIDGEEQVITKLDGTINNTNSQVTSSARIGGWRYNDDYRFKSHIDELKIYKGELNATTIADIYNTESNLVRTITCAQAIFNAVNRANGCFNWDNNITTKVAGTPIDLTILSADENDDNNSLTDTNITKIELLSFADSSCSTLYDTTELWSGNEEVNSSGCFNPSSFTHNKAIKCAKIRITGIYEGNSVEANSSDTFSIRPDKFILENLSTGKLTAEESYTFNAKAVNSDGSTASVDFNQSVTPQSKKYFRDDTDGSTMDGTFAPTAAFAFSDGITADTMLSFNNVGKIGLELNDTTWAEVDSDDTPLKDRTIYLEHNLTFIPDRFEITFDTTPTMDNHGRIFTYYANDLANMSADLKNLSFKVTAVGKNGATMTNYHNDTKYYANPINLTTALSIDQNPNITSENITKSGFNHGINSVNYTNRYFNFTRQRDITKEPIVIQGSNSDINITAVDTIDHEVNGTSLQTFDGNATFYYARIRAEDIRTAQINSESKIKVQIYSSSVLNGFQRDSLSWYLNKLDDFSIVGNRAEDKRKLTNTTVTDNTMTNGTQSFTITANPTDKSYKKFYHLNIPAWLWYSKYEDYAFSTNSTCATHPCFEYIYETNSDDRGIKSGDFKGTNFNNSFKSGIKKKAIKLMR